MKQTLRALAALVGLLLFLPSAYADLAIVQAGGTSQQLQVRAIVQATGAPDTALAYNTSGLSCSYQRAGATVTSITLATQTVSGAYSSGGFVHLANGWYRLDVPDAAVASGIPAVLVTCAATGDTFVDGRVSLSPSVNTVALNGTAQTARDIGASVLVSSGTGTGQISLTSGVAAVNVTQFGGMAATTSAGRPEVNTSHLAGSALGTLTGAYPALGIIESGTAQAGTGTTLQLRTAANFTSDNRITGASCLITGGTGAGESLNVASYVNSTDTATMAGTWPTTPDNTSTYICFGTSPATGATDPWATALPGSYTSGQAGNILAAVSTKTGFLPSATAGAAGGVLIAGTNADFDVTANASFAGGVTITQSTSNTAALVVTGNGTGNGATFTSGSGASGNGLQATAASTNGNGIGLTATGAGATMTITPSNVTQFGGSAGTFASGIPAVNSTLVGGQTASASGTVTFPNGTLASTTNITAGTIATVTNLTNAPTAGDFTATMKTSIGTAVAASAVASVTGNVGGTVNGLTSTAQGNVRTAVGLATANLDTQLAGVSAPTAATVAAAVWDLTTTGHTTGGTFGAAMGAAGAAGDPWSTSLPGSYTAGSAGYILGNRLDAAITSRLAPTTAGRTLDVSTGGEAGLDWANIGSPTTTVNLSATTISTGQAVASVSGAVGSVTTVSDKTGYTLSNAGIDAFADRSTTGHTTGGTWGGTWNAAGGAGDPWSTSLPGAYTSGQAGYIIGNNLNASMTSRMATFTLPTNFSSFSIDGSGRTLLQPTQTGVTIPTVTTLTNAQGDSSGVTTLLSRLGTPTGASVSADIAAVPTGVLNSVVEPNGSISLKCVLAADLAYNAGDLATSGTASTYKDPSNTSTRINATVSSAGNRLGSVTCPP